MADTQDKHKCFKIFVRILNTITALTLIGFGIAGMIYLIIKQLLAFRFFLIFSPIFMTQSALLVRIFGLMLLALDFKFKIIKKHFGFLSSFLGRGIFNFYLSSSVFYYFTCGNDSTVVGWIAAIIIFVLGVIYCIMHCCCRDKSNDQQSNNDTKNSMMNDSKI